MKSPLDCVGKPEGFELGKDTGGNERGTKLKQVTVYLLAAD